MFKKILMILVAIIFLTGLIGCETMGGPKQTGGTIIGAAGGAIVGSQFGKGTGRIVATALGTFIGSQIGAQIGKNMDERDKRIAGNTAANALEYSPDNRISTWRNPNNNHHGEFVVTRTRENKAAHEVCRDYVHTVIIDGEEQKLYGRACRDIRDPKAAWYFK